MSRVARRIERRRADVLRLVAERGRISTVYLAEILGWSPETIRADLEALRRDGKVRFLDLPSGLVWAAVDPDAEAAALPPVGMEVAGRRVSYTWRSPVSGGHVRYATPAGREVNITADTWWAYVAQHTHPRDLPPTPVDPVHAPIGISLAAALHDAGLRDLATVYRTVHRPDALQALADRGVRNPGALLHRARRACDRWLAEVYPPERRKVVAFEGTAFEVWSVQHG